MIQAPSGALIGLPEGISLRPVETSDLALLERIYASTRMQELAQTDWNEEQKAQFLRFQFQAQHRHYLTHYVDAQFFVILRLGVAAGRLYLHWRQRELRIVDVALLPEHRGQGAGAALLLALLALAAGESCEVSIHVERMNPAMTLYLRLGFRKCGEHGIYDRMHWRPEASTPFA